tara:strand:+ start:64 stop:294 length:231 start_codon:yes stop_codon:yes gene_type:complete
MKVNYQSKYIGIDTILTYLNKELKRVRAKIDEIYELYQNDPDTHGVEVYECDDYIEYCGISRYLHKLIKKVEEGSI